NLACRRRLHRSRGCQRNCIGNERRCDAERRHQRDRHATGGRLHGRSPFEVDSNRFLDRETIVRRASAIATLALLAGCGAPHAGAVVRHVVIVTLDTTRADYISAYGSTHVATPNIDALARTGAIFEQAATVAPLTLTAHRSLFPGLLPPHHGVRDNASDPLSADHTTLAEILHRRGFRTAAFVGSAVLQSSRGLSRGFDVYRDGVSDHP